MPPSHGIFLDVTWRMHPQLAGWVSEAICEGRPRAEGSLARQSLILGGKVHPALASFGLRFVPVEPAGRSRRAPEEVEVVADIWRNLQDLRWRDRHGVERSIGVDDVLVVAPYNVQVNELGEALPEGARVGTVDKFRGQEAPAVLVSMATSSGDDLPRDVDFLFSRNRLKVAVSRARYLSLVVASPRLLEVNCGSVDDLRLVNTLCHAWEWLERERLSGIGRDRAVGI